MFKPEYLRSFSSSWKLRFSRGCNASAARSVLVRNTSGRLLTPIKIPRQLHWDSFTRNRDGFLAVSAVRAYTTQTPPPSPHEEDKHEPKPEENTSSEIPPHMWIEALENTASAPWLNTLPTAHEDRMKRAYSLLFQIVIYLGRPQDDGQAEQYLIAFETAPVPPDSEIGRARTAVATLTRTIVHDLSSIPLNSPLRMQHSDTFDIFGALLALHDMYLLDADGKVEEWSAFWSRTQPILLTLGMKLDEDGYGLKDGKQDAK